ncbi:hypothetical protein WKT22_01068 [Candidatus Lokiarchaeum ossiferum]
MVPRVGISKNNEMLLFFEPTMPGSSVQCLPERSQKRRFDIFLGHRGACQGPPTS